MVAGFDWVEAFQGVVQRNRHVSRHYSRIPGSDPSEPQRVTRERQEPVRIAAISFEMHDGAFQHTDRGMPQHVQLVAPLGVRTSIPHRQGEAQIRSRVEAALRDLQAWLTSENERAPDLILVQEMGFPGGRGEIDEQEYLRGAFSEFQDAYLLAGSHHDLATNYNLAIFARPQLPNVGRLTERHPKRAAALGNKEGVEIPLSRDLPVYATELGRIGIMVCLDTYDASQMLAAAALNFASPAERIELLLVPAYNAGNLELFRNECRSISELLMNAVIVSHGWSPPEDPESSPVVNPMRQQFACVMGEFVDENTRAATAVRYFTTGLTLFDVDLNEIERQAQQKRALVPPELVRVFQKDRGRLRPLRQ